MYQGDAIPPVPMRFFALFCSPKTTPPSLFRFSEKSFDFFAFPYRHFGRLRSSHSGVDCSKAAGLRLPPTAPQRGAAGRACLGGSMATFVPSGGTRKPSEECSLGGCTEKKKLAAIAAYACGLMCVFIIVSLCSSDPHDLGSRQLDYRYSARRAPHARANGGGADLPRHSERGEGAKRPLYCGGGERSEGTPKTGVFGSCCQKAIKGESTGVLSPFFLGYGVMCPLRQGQGKATPLDVLLHL